VDKRSLVLYLSGLAAAGAVVGISASCSDQPRIKCTAGHGPFALVYTHVSGDNGCAPHMDATTNTGGEEMGVEAYNYPLADNSNLDPNRGSLGMQSFDLTARMDHHPPDNANKPYSLGDWGSAEPGADNFCTVPSISDSVQDLQYVPAVPPTLPDGGGGSPAFRALNVRYHWSNVRFYNTAGSPGTQLIAELAYSKTESLPDGGAGTPCTETVKVTGLWPFVGCAAEDPMDPDGMDETLCSPNPDNTKGRPLGSGISPDIAYKCDPILHLCVLAKDPPSFR